MRSVKVVQVAIAVFCLFPAAQAAAFGMGGGPTVGVNAPSVGVGTNMGTSSMTANGGNAAYNHGSPAASSNPAVAALEARQRGAQVASEIDQARRSGKDVRAADTELVRGNQALQAEHADQAMLAFDKAERKVGIRTSSAAMGSYGRSDLGSVTPGGTELSGAIVH